MRINDLNLKDRRNYSRYLAGILTEVLAALALAAIGWLVSCLILRIIW